MTNVDEVLLADAQVRIDEKFPGIKLESAIQGWAYLGDFEAGIRAFESLEEPSAIDDRWLGVCFFQRFEDMRAQEAFFRALSKGEEAARVNLAHLLRFLERSEEAATELSRVDTAKLNKYDLVLFLRVSSLHEETNGNIRSAVEHAERAWEQVQGIPEFQILAPSVLGQLGILYGRMGQARRALWFFEHGITLTTGLEQHKVKLRRATLLINLGRLIEAEKELHSLGELPDGLKLERASLYGELRWAEGRLDDATDHLMAVVQTAAHLALGSDEFMARLSLAAILIHRQRFTEAAEHLAWARILISDRTDLLLHRFREILLHIGRKQYGWENSSSELEMLAVEFMGLGTLQEEACVRLHLADLYRQQDDERCSRELHRVLEICRTVHNSMFLEKEWHLVPNLKQRANTDVPQLFGEIRACLRIRSLGQVSLDLNEEPIRLPLRRGVEILTYFLEHRHVSLAQLLRDLFPNEKPKTARSYFHQFRHQLRVHVPGLDVAYLPRECVYELRSNLELVWDVESLRSGVSSVDPGRFLPSSTSAWASQINEELRGLLEGGSINEPSL
jgi:tetratricopeptide (TPR) repeat protein